MEHIVHFLLLPDIHSSTPHPTDNSADSLDIHNTDEPHIKFLGAELRSPLHFTLRVLTLLSFNDSGKITSHRDIWDIKEVIKAIVPLARPTLWITSRLGGHGLAAFSRAAFWLLGRRGASETHEIHPSDTSIISLSLTGDGVTTDEDEMRNALGLLGIRQDSSLTSGQDNSRNINDPYNRGSQATDSDSLASVRHYPSSSYGTSVDFP